MEICMWWLLSSNDNNGHHEPPMSEGAGAVHPIIFVSRGPPLFAYAKLTTFAGSAGAGDGPDRGRLGA